MRFMLSWGKGVEGGWQGRGVTQDTGKPEEITEVKW